MAHWSRLRVSRRTFFRKPGQWTRWAAFDWSEKYEESFFFMLFTFILDFSMGSFLIVQNPASIQIFFSLKRTHSSEKEEGKSVPFSITPIYFTFSLLPRSASLRERKQPLFSGVAPPPSLSNSSRPPLLCMKHRSRLKAFSGHSDAEEKRSSELY